MISTRSIKRMSLRKTAEHLTKQPGASVWKNIWGFGSLAVACLASPCCTPLLVPVVLSLLAGTPLAVFLAPFIGWVYAGLTVLSLVSLYVGWRWLRQRTILRPSGNNEVPASACSIDCSCQSGECEVKP